MQQYIKNKFNENNIKIDHVEFCPHHPQATIKKYRKFCNCRKPNNGMINNILSNWLIDKKNSLMIGDKFSDELCTKKSNLKFYYYYEKLYNELL